MNEWGSKNDTADFVKEISRENRFSEKMEYYFVYVKFGGLLEVQVEILSKHVYIDIHLKIQIVESSAHRRLISLALPINNLQNINSDPTFSFQT